MKGGNTLISGEDIAQKQQKDEIKYLYHYTSIPVLHDILFNKEFWWGNTATMNDRTEIQNFVLELRRGLTLQVLPSKQKEFDYFFTKLEGQIVESYPFVMSFSKLNDDAAQWERYADSAQGVCIKFNRAKLQKLFYYQPIVSGWVEYDYNIKKHEHYSILADYFHNDRKLCGFNSLDELASNILVTASMYKHESFSSENEYRFATLSSNIDGIFNIPCSVIDMKVIGRDIKKYLKCDLSRMI